MPRVLIVGGTGPTGVPLANRFLHDGHEVAILHSGRHPAEFDGPVERIIGNARDGEDLKGKLEGREWDIAVCMYGRLRVQAEVLAGRTGRLVGITGQPVYRGAQPPTPEGRIPLPIPEYAPRQYDGAGYTSKIAAGEDQLFEQHGRGDFEAVIVRYPGVFGPRAPMNHEWPVVKRILDGRPFLILPHDGVTYFQRGYADNLAHLVHLAATRPEAAGEAFNAGDERVLSCRYVAEVIRDELESDIEFVGIPAEFCRGVFPLAEKSNQMLDMSKARNLLGYRDVVDVETATRRTAVHLRDRPPEPEDLYPAGTGKFDYEREDRIVRQWRGAVEFMHQA